MHNNLNETTASTLIYSEVNILAAAQDYLRSGYSVTPIQYQDKKPMLPQWQKCKLTEVDLSAHFATSRRNIGIVLGEQSDGLVDVDIDDDDALLLARHFLPSTALIFGRKSRKDSHWLYHCSTATPKKFTDHENVMLVEIRGNNQQTVFPPSVHVSGERIEFSRKEAATSIDYERLILACEKLCIATSLYKNWGNGSRHALTLAISGLLAKNFWQEADAKQIVEAVAVMASDQEVDDRLKCVSNTFAKFASGQPIQAKDKLVELLGDKLASKICQWARASSDMQMPVRLLPNEATTLDLSSDQSAAHAFAKSYEGILLYCVEQGSWFRRDSQLYRPITPVAVQGVATRFTRKVMSEISNRLPYGTQPRTLGSCSRINGTIQLSRADFSVDWKKIDSTRNLMGLEDGSVFDLNTMALAQSTTNVVTKSMGVSYDAGADCPHWRDFLDRIFDKNREIIDFIQRSVGYTLSGEVGEQCFFVLVGTGANGKSTFINALNSLFGNYAEAIPMHTLMQQSTGNDKTNDLALLPGKRLVTASEGEQGQRLAESRIKLLTGGDKITCRALYKEYFGYDPQFKLWLATNNLPRISGVDEAIWRRIRVIRFPVTIPVEERDPDLGHKLQAELPGILNWALQGHFQWKLKKLSPPSQVLQSTDAYRLDNDVVEQFISACCVKAPLAVTSVKDLYERYIVWSENSGQDPVHKNVFGKTLAQKGFEKKATKHGTAWRGIGLS